jgi:hypothetical protein
MMAKQFFDAPQKRAAFGRRGVRRVEDSAVAQAPARSETREISFRRVRLRVLGVEVSLFYEARFDELTPQFRVRRDEFGPYLSVGDPTGLLLKARPEATIDEAGLPFRGGPEAREVSFAIGESPPLDQSAHALALRTTDIAVDMLVGQSIEAVERQLVLRTLRSFKGDYRQTACALGISIGDLSQKLSAILCPEPHRPFIPEDD